MSPGPATGLVPLDARQSLRAYLSDVWQRRQFAAAIAAGELRGQHMDTVLGNVWHVLNPALLVAVYFFIFDVLLNTSRGVVNFLGFLTVGIFIYGFLNRMIQRGARSVVGNEGLIRSLQFPRAVLPIATVVKELLAFGASMVVMFAVLLVTGEWLRPGWLMLVPILVLALMFGLGSAMFAARLTDQVRDFANILPFLFRLAFYLSGILYSIDAWVSSPTYQRLFVINPFYAFVTLPRAYLMTSYEPQHVPALWLSAATWALVALTVGTWYFRRGETEFGRG